MKFLCTNSQGIQIIRNSTSKTTIRDLKCFKQMFPKSIQQRFTVICKSIWSFLFSFFVTFETFEIFLPVYPENWLNAKTNLMHMD